MLNATLQTALTQKETIQNVRIFNGIPWIYRHVLTGMPCGHASAVFLEAGDMAGKKVLLGYYCKSFVRLEVMGFSHGKKRWDSILIEKESHLQIESFVGYVFKKQKQKKVENPFYSQNITDLEQWRQNYLQF